MAESAEGSRLLSGYRGKTSVPGSNPGLSAKAPLAQMDRASDYESEGQRFDSSRAHQLLASLGGGARRTPSGRAGFVSEERGMGGIVWALTLALIPAQGRTFTAPRSFDSFSLFLL